MPARNALAQSWKIDRALTRNFSAHLIVRTPKNMESRLREGDWFLREIVARGKVLYELAHTHDQANPSAGAAFAGSFENDRARM